MRPRQNPDKFCVKKVTKLFSGPIFWWYRIGETFSSPAHFCSYFPLFLWGSKNVFDVCQNYRVFVNNLTNILGAPCTILHFPTGCHKFSSQKGPEVDIFEMSFFQRPFLRRSATIVITLPSPTKFFILRTTKMTNPTYFLARKWIFNGIFCAFIVQRILHVVWISHIFNASKSITKLKQVETKQNSKSFFSRQIQGTTVIYLESFESLSFKANRHMLQCHFSRKNLGKINSFCVRFTL